MGRLQRLKDYTATHGIGYTIRRCGEKTGQIVFGTWDREWKKIRPGEAELQRMRQNQPEAGRISVVIPVYNTRENYLRDLLQSLRDQVYENWEAVLYDGEAPLTVLRLGADAAPVSDYAFYRCTNELTVEAAEGYIGPIGSYAFAQCAGLQSARFGRGVSEVGA